MIRPATLSECQAAYDSASDPRAETDDDNTDHDETDNCCPLCGIEIAPGERHRCPDED